MTADLRLNKIFEMVAPALTLFSNTPDADELSEELTVLLKLDVEITIQNDDDIIYPAIAGYAVVPTDEWDAPSLEVIVSIPPHMDIDHMRQEFIHTLVHEYTHTTQIDDGVDPENYLENPLEIDAYSAEAAYQIAYEEISITETHAFNSYADGNVSADVMDKFISETIEKSKYIINTINA